MKIAIYIGTFYTAPLFTDKIGGSEIMAIQLGESLLKNKIATKVVIYGALDEQNNHRFTSGGVECRTWHNMMHDTEKFDVLIVSRFLYAFKLYNLARFDRKFYWVHDAIFHNAGVVLDENTRQIMPVTYDKYGFPEFKAIEHDIEKVIFVSSWQMQNLCMIPEMISGHVVLNKDKMCVIPNGLLDEVFDYDISNKKPHSFILTTDPQRAMPNILQMWPVIRNHFPDATLDVYFYGDIPVEYTDMFHKMKENGITWKGKALPTDIYTHVSKSQYYLYPLIGHETFGLSTVQASALGCHVIATDFSGIGETGRLIGSLLIDRHTDMMAYANTVVQYMKQVDDGKITMDDCRRRAREYFSFVAIIDKWAHLLRPKNQTR